jgi:uncharacterized membrane protein
MPTSFVLNALVIFCIICWGAWGIFDKVALERASSSRVLATIALLSTPFMIGTLIYLKAINPLWMPTFEVMLFTLGTSLSVLFAMLFYLKAMSVSEASLVLGATSAYTLFTQFGSWIVLQEPLVSERILGSILITLGVVLISGSAKFNLKADRATLLLLLYMLLASFLWGAVGVAEKKALTFASPMELFFGKALWESLFAIGFYAYFKAKNKPSFVLEKAGFGWVAGSAFCLQAGSIAYLLALSMATASYVVTICGCYPLLMYLLAVLILKETFNMQRLSGIALVTIGGILTQFTQAL